MFKKVFETLSRALAANDKAPERELPVSPPPPSPAPAAVPEPADAAVPAALVKAPPAPEVAIAPVASVPVTIELPIEEPSPAPARTSPAAALEEAAKAAELAAAINAVRHRLDRPADELCGVHHQMSTDEIRQRLAFLYKRYNRATSSLDAALRVEADLMLDAVVAMREKHFGPI